MLNSASAANKLLAYSRLNPPGVRKDISAADLIDRAFLAYNGGRLPQAAKLLTATMLPCDGFIGLSPTSTTWPGDSPLGLNVAGMALRDSKLLFDGNRDVNQSAAIVYEAKSTGHKSSVFILGGGSPKNFILQTEPQIQEIMGLQEKGHDYFLQCTDARPDTGGLSGATPAEAVSWGKVDPDTLPDCVVAYADATIALPLLTAYCLSRVKPRKLKRLYHPRDAIYEKLRSLYLKIGP